LHSEFVGIRDPLERPTNPLHLNKLRFVQSLVNGIQGFLISQSGFLRHVCRALHTLTAAIPHMSVDLFFQDDRGNPTTVSIQGRSLSQHGYSLPPWGTLDVITDGVGPLKVGSIRLVSQRGVSSEIEGTLVFEHLGYHVSVDSSPARSTHQVFVSRRSGEDTGIAIYNPNAEAVSLDLSLLDNQGSQTAGGQLTLQAFEHKSLYVHQIDVFSGYFSSVQSFYGTLNIAVRGDKKISALGLLIKSTGAMIAISTSAKVYR
jgi:hypothetical protein